MHFRGNAGRNSHVSSAWEATGGRSIHFISRLRERKTKKESTTHRRMRHKLCIFTLRPTHFVQSSNDCPRRRSKSTLCPFASWDTMGKKRSFAHCTRPKPSSTTARHSPRQRAAAPSEGLPLVRQDRDVASEQKKHTTVNRPWHGPRPRSAPRCCGRNGRCAQSGAWVRPRPRAQR